MSNTVLFLLAWLLPFAAFLLWYGGRGRPLSEPELEGFIAELSKVVVGGIGEAVGINYVSARDKKALQRQLQRVDDQDYFERGIELAIAEDGMRVEPLDISDLYAVEVDFAEDLERANLFV